MLLQETMLEMCDSQVWNVVGRGHLEGYIALEAVGRSGGVLETWNKTLFAKVDHRAGRHVVAVQLSRHSDDRRGWWSPSMAPPPLSFGKSCGQTSWGL